LARGFGWLGGLCGWFEFRHQASLNVESHCIRLIQCMRCQGLTRALEKYGVAFGREELLLSVDSVVDQWVDTTSNVATHDWVQMTKGLSMRLARKMYLDKNLMLRLR
jgi:hypothetical protein